MISKSKSKKAVQAVLSAIGIAYLTHISSSSMAMIFLPCILYYLYSSIDHERITLRNKKYSILTAVLFTVISIMGQYGKNSTSLYKWFQTKEWDSIIKDNIFQIGMRGQGLSSWFMKENCIFLLLEIFGLFVLYLNLFKGVYKYLDERRLNVDEGIEKGKYPIRILIFLSILIPYLLNLLCAFPGFLSYDSLNHLYQINGDIPYHNAHPILSTLIISVFYNLGVRVGGTANIGVAVYSLFQILLMASCFTYAICIVKKYLRITNICAFALAAFYGCFPLYGIYSVTMWKDVPFSCGILLLSISVLEMCFQKEMSRKNAFIYGLSAIWVCLLRKNGVAAVVFSALFLVIHYRKQLFRMLSLAIVPFCVVIMFENYIVPAVCGQSNQGISIDLYNLPVQQICRVIVEDKEIAENDKMLIEETVTFEEIKQTYNSRYADPMKIVIGSNMDAFLKNISEYRRIWFDLARKYPIEYLAAWIDFTVGYWYPDILYIQGYPSIDENILGICCNPILKEIDYYGIMKAAEKIPVYGLFWSCGFYFIAAVLGMIVLCYTRSKKILPAFIPAMCIWLIVILGSPIYAETRYVLPLHFCIPVLIVSVYYQVFKRSGGILCE